MNGRAYIIARLMASFGFPRKTKRLTDASNESHLLKQAKGLLGQSLWASCEGLEGVSVEYWTLRKLDQKKEELKFQLDEANKELDFRSDQRTKILNETNEEGQSREEDHALLMKELEELNTERVRVTSKAHLVRRKIDASRTKIEVLSDVAQGSPEVETERGLVVGYTEEFEVLKASRDRVASEIAEISIRIESLETHISEDRAGLKSKASVVFQSIGKANRDASAIASEMGLLDLEIQKSQVKIGHYLSQNTGIDPACSKICSKQKGMIAQMRSLEASVLRNHKIASMDS